MKKNLIAKYGTAFVLFSILLITGNTMAYGYTAWQDDRFDSIYLGPLNGQNGWTGTVSAQIIADDRYGGNSLFKVLYIDPAVGQTITCSKPVVQQFPGYHYIDLMVRIDNADPLQPTLAKLEFTTNGNPWKKKFQVYFGANIRVNYDSAGNDIMVVESTETGRWYWIRLELNMDNTSPYYNEIVAFVDGQVIDDGIHTYMPYGAIIGLVLTGWDRPGEVYLDDIYCIRRS
jgi:hypothetical protein